MNDLINGTILFHLLFSYFFTMFKLYSIFILIIIVIFSDLQWHELEKEQQAIYYEKAKAERQLHMQRYPGWSAKDNYAVNQRKKKKKRDKSGDGGKLF